MELEGDILLKTHDFGRNLNNELGLVLTSLIEHATHVACKSCGLTAEDGFESAVQSAGKKGVKDKFMTIYVSVLKDESDRYPLAREILLATAMRKTEYPPSGYARPQLVN